MAENEGGSMDLRSLSIEQRAEWLARTLVDLADAHSDVRAAAEVVLSSGWQPGAYAVLPGDMYLDADGGFRPANLADLHDDEGR